MKTLEEPMFSFFPLGLKLKTVAGKMLKDHGGNEWVLDAIEEEKLHYFVTSVNEDGRPNGAKSFDELMAKNNGFLTSVTDGVVEITKKMPGAKYKGINRQKMITHVADLTTKGQKSVTYQQELATQIQRILSGKKPMDVKIGLAQAAVYCLTFRTCPLRTGTPAPGAMAGPRPTWPRDNDEPAYWRGRSGVLV